MLCSKFELIPIKIGFYTNFKSCLKIDFHSACACTHVHNMIHNVHVVTIPVSYIVLCLFIRFFC